MTNTQLPINKVKIIVLTASVALNLLVSGICFSQNSYADTSPTSPPASATQSPDFMFNLSDTVTPGGQKTVEGVGWMTKGFNFFFDRGIALMVGTIGGIAVLMIVIGGFRMIMAGAKEDEYTKGWAMVKNSLIGLAFVLSAYILVTSIQLLIKSIFT